MSLPHALLTALVERTGSGLELSARFDKSIGLFWNASHQQIYRDLAALERSGWIESVAVPSARGRKKIYRVLPAGRSELRRWAGQPEDPKPVRNELMLRLRADAALGGTDVVTDIERHAALHRERLVSYEAIERRDFAGQLSREARVQHLILQAGIMTERMWIEWSERALEVMRDQAKGTEAPEGTSGGEGLSAG